MSDMIRNSRNVQKKNFSSIAVPEEIIQGLDRLNPKFSKPRWKKIAALLEYAEGVGNAK
jgi:hypothetical protein